MCNGAKKIIIINLGQIKMGWLDNLYCDKKIIERLANFDSFKKFAIEKTGGVPDLKGYLFLAEITINSIINDTEFLIDGDLYNILHWGEPDERRDEVREILKGNNKEIVFIRELEELRGELTKLRMNNINEDELKKAFNKILSKVNDVTDFYFKKIKYKTNPEGKSGEDWHIVNNLFCIKNYVESSFDLVDEEGESEIKPLFIPGSHYTAMTSQTSKNYHLQNPKTNEEVYVPSYSLGLAWLYFEYISNDLLLSNMISSKKWEDMHHNGARLNEFFEEDFKKKHQIKGWVPDIFKENYSNKNQKQINKTSLDNIGELRLILRDREVRTMEELHEGDYTVIRSIMDLIIHGLSLYSDKNNKMEIVEFKTKYNNGEEIKYSYAIFLPVGGGLWNASEWLFFNEISVENSWEKVCDFKERIYFIIKARKEKVNFKSYTIKKENLICYRKRHDIAFRRRLAEIEQLKTSEGLLVELIAFFYYLKKNKEKLEDFGWHVNPPDNSKTDLDAYFVTESGAEIIQAKKSLNITNPRLDSPMEEIEKADFDPVKHLRFDDDLKEIYKHFNEAEKILIDKLKTESKNINTMVKKLFVFEKGSEDEDWLLEELKKELKKKGIELIYFEEIEKDKNLFSKDLIEKINIAFDRIVFNSEDNLE